MKLRLLLLLAAYLLGGCNIMPEEDPGYHVSTGAYRHWKAGARLAGAEKVPSPTLEPSALLRGETAR